MTVTCNPSPFNKPGQKPPPAHVPASKRAEMIRFAQWAVEHTDQFRYTEDARRSELFNCDWDALLAGRIVVHADCSQFYASAAHHVGIPGLTDTDYTGTLLQKGKLVAKATPGDCVIFGGGTGEHAAMVTYNGFCIGFGHWPGAPNRVKLKDMIGWFAAHGHPGVRYLRFA